MPFWAGVVEQSNATRQQVEIREDSGSWSNIARVVARPSEVSFLTVHLTVFPFFQIFSLSNMNAIVGPFMIEWE